jgi:hypothetical protein
MDWEELKNGSISDLKGTNVTRQVQKEKEATQNRENFKFVEQLVGGVSF